MMIVYTGDLFCDYKDPDGSGCLNWIDGLTQNGTAPTKTKVREVAHSRVPESMYDDEANYGTKWVTVNGKDYCPVHRGEGGRNYSTSRFEHSVDFGGTF